MTTTETNLNQTMRRLDHSIGRGARGEVFQAGAGPRGHWRAGLSPFPGDRISNHPGHVPLVRALNVAAEASAGLMYGMTALVVIFGVVVVGLSFTRPEN